MTYLITGVTGGLGNGVLKDLSKTVSHDEIAVLVRSEAKGVPFAEAGYAVRVGDYSDKESLVNVFSGIETLMFVSGAPGQALSRELQHKHVIEAAKAAGIENLVYTSLANAEGSHSVLAPDHIATEAMIKQSGLTYKILRNNWYLENELGIFQDALAGKGFVYAGDEGKVGWALKREYAEAAAQALVQSFDDDHIYELSGPRLSYADLHQALETATGKTIDVVSMTISDYKAALVSAGLPDEVVGIVRAIQSDISAGELDVTSTDFETLLGHALTPVTDAISELLA